MKLNSFNTHIAVVLVILCSTAYSGANEVDQVDDTDLVHLLTGEESVVVLFTKPECPKCEEFETVIENVLHELKDSLSAVVVKASNSHLVGIYDPSREPSLVYFRKGIPLLYHGEINEEEIMQTFINNKEPIVRELADENFEHLTQAATGATTGDWFVFFYSADCVYCQRLYAVWEAVGSKLRHRLNVARVNRLEAGISTAKRFGVTRSPEFILLRQGSVYRYKKKDYTPANFIEFVESGYRKQTHPEKVPPEPGFMADLLTEQLKTIVSSSTFWIFGSIAVSLTVVFGFVRNCLSAKKTAQVEKKKKSK